MRFDIIDLCSFLPPVYVVRGKVIFILGNVCLFTFGRGPRSQIFGGVPGLRCLGGSQVSDFRGGARSQIFGGAPRSQIFAGGSQVSDFRGGGVPGLTKGKNFWHQIWLDTCSDWKKKFLLRDSPPQLKGKIFDTRFGLIHVQTGKKSFCWGTPPPN